MNQSKPIARARATNENQSQFQPWSQIIKEYTPSILVWILRLMAVNKESLHFCQKLCNWNMGENISLPRPFFSLLTIHLFVGHLPLVWPSFSSAQANLCYMGCFCNGLSVFIPCQQFPLTLWQVFYQPGLFLFPLSNVCS